MIKKIVYNIWIVCLYAVDLLYKQTKKIMKKVEFVQQTAHYDNNKMWYYTAIDGSYVSDSGHYDKEIAYEKFIILSNGGSLLPIKTILETKTID